MMQLGDWVQAKERVTEPGLMGDAVWIHAERGGIGHVISLTTDPDWVDVFFERTETISVCHVDELRRLGSAEVGRAPIPGVAIADLERPGGIEIFNILRAAEDLETLLRNWNVVTFAAMELDKSLRGLVVLRSLAPGLELELKEGEGTPSQLGRVK